MLQNIFAFSFTILSFKSSKCRSEISDGESSSIYSKIILFYAVKKYSDDLSTS